MVGSYIPDPCFFRRSALFLKEKGIVTMETEKTIQQARTEIRAVLRRYRVSWNDVVPDRDMELWRTVRPVAKEVRKVLFRKAYPSLR